MGFNGDTIRPTPTRKRNLKRNKSPKKKKIPSGVKILTKRDENSGHPSIDRLHGWTRWRNSALCLARCLSPVRKTSFRTLPLFNCFRLPLINHPFNKTFTFYCFRLIDPLTNRFRRWPSAAQRGSARRSATYGRSAATYWIN